MSQEPKFTIKEIKNYLLKQDSRGDIMYNLSAENIIAANGSNNHRFCIEASNSWEDRDIIYDGNQESEIYNGGEIEIKFETLQELLDYLYNNCGFAMDSLKLSQSLSKEYGVTNAEDLW